MARDYTQEVGLSNNKKNLPKPVAFVVLALVAVGVAYGVIGIVSETKEHSAAEAATKNAQSQPAAPAPVAPAN